MRRNSIPPAEQVCNDEGCILALDVWAVLRSFVLSKESIVRRGMTDPIPFE